MCSQSLQKKGWHSDIPKERRRRRDSHTQHLEDKLRDHDTIINKMATEMEAMRRQIKGKGIVGVGNHSEHAHSHRSGSLNRRRTPSLSVTRSFRAGDYVAVTTSIKTAGTAGMGVLTVICHSSDALSLHLCRYFLDDGILVS